MRVFVIAYDDFLSYRDDVEALNNKVIQKYVITFDDFNYLGENECFTYPPTAKMQGVEMCPPLNM